ncbi:MAG: DHH family phosphoesterase [Candidatus Bilamarchaeaceae archaeon]
MNFQEACEEARRVALSFNEPLIVHHHDCDGITSGAIVVSAFLAAGKKFRRECIKKLDDAVIERYRNERELIFVDIGGGHKRVNELCDVVIIDHHQTEGIKKLQVNPMLYGINGGEELSAAGTAYLVFGERIELAITGAVGDMQWPLRGKNREILADGINKGLVRTENDLRFYGRYSRPLIQFLEYSDEPYIPGISYREDKAAALLTTLGIPIKKGEEYRRYVDLTKEEKIRLASALAEILVERGRIASLDELIGESYVFPKNKMNETYEASEFSTLLNACGRHARDDIGIRVALGDEGCFQRARSLLQLHRRMLKEGIEFARGNIQDFGAFFFLDGRKKIDEAIIGTICGMVLEQRWKKPIVGIASSDEGGIKASARGRGVNLGLIMRKAAEIAHGVGGGHRIAAGASFPADKLNEFLLAVGKELREDCKIRQVPNY